METTNQHTAQPQAVPRSVLFRKERESSWQELEDIVAQVQRKSLSALDDHELHRLPILYREAINSLSVARATALDRSLIQYLEALCAQSYLVIYGSRRPARRMLWALFVAVPNQIRKSTRELFLATLFFALGITVAWSLTDRDPQWFHVFVNKQMSAGRTPWASTESLRNSLYHAQEDKSGLSVFASFLFTNNARVGMLAFSLGFLLGIPAALLLFYNGLVLGAFFSVFASRGLLVPFLGWLLPHGIPEIFAVLLCGGAGFLMGRALLLPERYRRTEALRNAGLKASLIVVGAIFLFAYAAIFEGFFRQLIVDDVMRFLLATLQILLLLWWFRIARRQEQRDLAAENFEMETNAA
ncbi:MAG: stage II sporulation protein M [Myxococcales bacterium]|nr:stage II sporulation protein M [Myxococcales bacterium]MCB9642105.1 stage II sporulation protein M [Myxococcales bacterium]